MTADPYLRDLQAQSLELAPHIHPARESVPPLTLRDALLCLLSLAWLAVSLYATMSA